MTTSKRLLVLSFIVLVVPTLMGAKLTLKVTPNPNGDKHILEGKGTVELAKGETFVKITFKAVLKDSSPIQFSTVDGTRDGSRWSAKLRLPSDKTFTPTQADLHFIDAAGKPCSTSVVVKTDQVVK